MVKRFSTNCAILFAIIDSVLVVAALFLSNLLRPHLSLIFPGIKNITASVSITPLVYIITGLIWIIILIRLGLYDPEKNFRVVDEVYNLFIGAIIALVFVSGFFYLYNLNISRMLFVLFAILTFGMELSYRLIFRILNKSGSVPLAKHNRMLIVGAGVVGRRFEKSISGYVDLGYELVGYVDDNLNLGKNNLDVLGTVDETKDLVEAYHIDDLIIALPRHAHKKINVLVKELHELPIRIWIIPDYFSWMLSTSSIKNFAGIPMINLREPALSTKQRVRKRIFDLVVTIPLFILILPLIGIISIIIKIDSKGPIFYKSTRIKENGETFEMIKFRTMIPNAHALLSQVIRKNKNGEIVHKHSDDPRLTKVGKFLRKTSLDELPQLINIIKGDMSLVGPRPELTEMVKLYKDWQYKRFAVPQGLTGWWQINGRSDQPMHLNTEKDLYYIQNYSLGLDIQILIKTILIVLRGKGAY